MAIEASILLGGKGVRLDSPLDMATKAMTMRSLANQNKQFEQNAADKMATRNALASNYETDEAGNTTLNRRGVMADLSQTNPEQAMSFEDHFRGKDLNKLKTESDAAKTIAWGITPENYSASITKARQLGLSNADKLPEQYEQNFVERWKISTLSGAEQLSLKIKEMDIKGRKSEKIGKVASDLRKERSGLDTTKATQKVSAAYNKVQLSGKSPSPAGDLSLIFNYMKMLDPGSVVRESEFRSAEQAKAWMSSMDENGQGIRVPSIVRTVIQKADKGTFLLPEQRRDFINKAGGLYDAQIDIQKQVDAGFANIAIKQGIDPADIILNFSANIPEKKRQLQSRQKRGGILGGNEEAHASDAPARPGTVIQNGFVYTLNPSTGEYE